MLVLPDMALAQIVAAPRSTPICASLTRQQPPIPSAKEDNSAWGASIIADPGELHRIYFQNIDGLRNDVDEI